MGLEANGYFNRNVFRIILIHVSVVSAFGTFGDYFHRIGDNVTANNNGINEVTSVLQCATLCVQNQTCTVIQYFKNNRTCFMLFDAQEDIDIAPMWTNSTIETYSRIVSMFDFNRKQQFSNVFFFRSYF